MKVDLADIKQLPVTHAATIPEEYLDAMGHMNVMWYTHLFSMAMGGLFQHIGLHWKDLKEIQGGTFALESHIRYLSEVRVGQTVEVHSRMIGRSEKRYHGMHFMTNLDKGDVAAIFEFVSAYIDLRVRRMAPIPNEVAQRIDQLVDEHSALIWPAPISGIMKP